MVQHHALPEPSARRAFHEWLETDCPDEATIEVNYEPVTEPALAFLQRFHDCTDLMPGAYREIVAGLCDLDEDDPAAWEYGPAARRLAAFVAARWAA